MIHSARGGLLFAHVSRTGGLAITAALRAACADVTDLLGQHEALAAARPLLGAAFEATLKFAFVRNPWDRLVSWYALIGQTTTDADPAARADPTSAHWRQFDRFLESWAGEQVRVDGVVRRRLSQWGQLADAEGVLLADEIGRFETLAEDARRIFSRLGLPAPALPVLNDSRHLHYARYYSEFGRELVGEAFREDVVGFGYAFEDGPPAPGSVISA